MPQGNVARREERKGTESNLATHRNSIGKVELVSFCVMSNHSHQILKYSDGVENVSRFMRVAHGDYGRRYNQGAKRSGKVANERPRTVLYPSCRRIL